MRAISPKEMSEELSRNKLEIVAGFLGLTHALVPAASDLSTAFLKDHLPEQIDVMAAVFRDSGGRSSKAALEVLAAKHGSQRATDPDYSLDFIRREYQILRSLIINLLKPTEYMSHESVSLFGEISETTIAKTTEAFFLSRMKVQSRAASEPAVSC